MERLECSMVNCLCVKTGAFRFDSEYYSKSNLKLEDLIKSTKGRTIENLNGMVDCSAFYPSITGAYSNDRTLVPFIRVNEIQNGLIVLTEDTVFLPKNILDENAGTIARAYPGDIVIAKGGNTLAKVGLVTDEYSEYATCRDVIILRTNKLYGINKYYLWSFLHSKYGQNLMWRSASQTGQPHITLPIISNMHIPEFSDEFQDEVQKIYIASVQNKRLAEESYKRAETYLLEELGIDMSQLDNSAVAIRSFKTMLIAERFDSEYFRPKYDEVVRAIFKYDKNARTLNSIAKYLFTGEYADSYSAYSDGLCHYVRGTDIHGGIVEVDDEHSVDPRKHSKFLSTDDIVTGRVGTIGNFGVVSESLDGSVCSDNVLCFHLPANYLPNVYALYFNSPIIKEITKRMSRGSVQQRMNQETLRELIVPFISESAQIKINKEIVHSLNLMEKASRLLNIAKSALEMAIEYDEKLAYDWMNSSFSEV